MASGGSYSGFPTRKQEEFYNKLVSRGINMLTEKILNGKPYDQIKLLLAKQQNSVSTSNFGSV